MPTATRPRAVSASPFILASLALVLPVSLRAQSSSASVVSEITIHVDEPRGMDTVVYQRSITRAGKDTAAGTRTGRELGCGRNRSRAIARSRAALPSWWRRDRDTAIAALKTLRAVAHRSHQPTRTMRFDFVGTEADGTVTESASTKDSTAVKGPSISHSAARSSIPTSSTSSSHPSRSSAVSRRSCPSSSTSAAGESR